MECYLAEYRNLILMISDINDGEKLDRFLDLLKDNVRVEVLKKNSTSFEECARLALNVDSAIWRARRSTPGFHYNKNNVSEPTPMEIGNVNSGSMLRVQREQRRNDLDKGTCFKCHKVGCRPWKCRPRVNNVEVGLGTVSDDHSIVQLSDSEDE